MTLTQTQKLAWRFFREPAKWQVKYDPGLKMRLERAHMPETPELYIAFLDLLAFFAFFEGLLVTIVVAVLLPAAGVEVPVWGTAVAVIVPILLPLLVYTIGRLWPEVRASERAGKIDYMLPAALNYMAAMGSSGMTPDKMLASLGRQHVYGEAAEEARWVATQVKWMGKDLLSALQEAIPRTPSARLQDIWQGMAAAISSGASLKEYLLAKAEQMHRDNASQQRRQLDNLGLLAESFLVVAVAMPIFLIILLTIMGSSGAGAQQSRTILWAVVLVLLPLSQGGFAFAVAQMRGKV